MNASIQSPFMYREGSHGEVVESNSISYREYKKLKANMQINKEAIYLMNLLFQYKFLTTYLINNFIMANNMDTNKIRIDLEGKAVAKLLTKLIKFGIVSSGRISWQQLKSDTKANKIVLKSTPLYYSLTRGGIACLGKELGKRIMIDQYLQILSASAVLKKLALNQLISSYKLKVSNLKDVKVEVPVRLNQINRVVDIHSLLTVDAGGYEISLIIEPIRRNDNWQQDLMERISLINQIIKEHFLSLHREVLRGMPVVILLCEDDVHMNQVYSFSADIINNRFFFTTDVRQLEDKLLSSLIQFEKINGKITFTDYKVNFLK